MCRANGVESSREGDESLPLIEPDMQISSIRLTDTRVAARPTQEAHDARQSERSP